MKFFCVVMTAAALATALLFTGCSTTDDVEICETDRKGDAFELGEKLTADFCDGDAGAFVDRLPENFRKEFGIPQFKATHRELSRKLGKPKHHEFITRLKHPLCDVQLWRIAFERPSSDGKGVVEQDAVFQIVIGREDGKPRVMSFGIL